MLLWVLRQVAGSDAQILLSRLVGHGVGREVGRTDDALFVSIPCQGRNSV